MAQPTKRDRIWLTALTKAIRSGDRVTPTDIVDDTTVSERIARETLVVISQNGWLERRSNPDGSVYYSAPRDIVVE